MPLDWTPERLATEQAAMRERWARKDPRKHAAKIQEGQQMHATPVYKGDLIKSLEATVAKIAPFCTCEVDGSICPFCAAQE